MKKILLGVIIIFALFTQYAFAQQQKPPVAQAQGDAYSQWMKVFLGFNLMSYLVSGKQYDQPNDSFSPSVDNFSSSGLFLGLEFYPTQTIGGLLRFNRSTTTANSNSGESTNLYDFSYLELGPVLRYQMADMPSINALEFTGSLGVNLNHLQYSDDYKSVIEDADEKENYPNAYDSDGAGGLGFYASVGGDVYITDLFFVGVQFHLMQNNPAFPDDAEAFDGMYFSVPIRAGVYF
jgi:hypothetical protein